MFDLSRTKLVAVGDQSSNCSSKIEVEKSIDNTTWPQQAQIVQIEFIAKRLG